jgi:ketosteroid isomerase-like protein
MGNAMNPNSHDPSLSQHPATPVVRQVLDAITTLDLAAAVDCLHRDLTFELPYEAAVPPLDRSGFAELLRVMFTMYETFDLTCTHVYDLRDDQTVIARYEGNCRARETGAIYANNYLGIFQIADGRIRHWREYDDPTVSAAALSATQVS